MPVMLFKLRGVPEDEADEVRAVLTELNIDFYETPADRWGVSMPGIWLKDDDRLEQARQAIDDYQQQRVLKVREEYEQLKKSGQAETFLSRIRHRPLLVLMFIVMLAFVMYFFLTPFYYFVQPNP